MTQRWREVRIGDVATVVRGVTYKKQEASAQPQDGTLPLLRATNFDSSIDLDGQLVHVPERVVRPDQRLRQGDILVASSSGSISVVGKSARLSTDWAGTFGAFCAVIRASDEVDSRYLRLYINTDQVRSRWSAAARGTNINNLKRSDLESTPVPLPPLEEQRHVVKVVEDHLSRLDAADAYLAASRRRMNRLEQTALASCREGDLRSMAEVTAIQGGIQKQPKRAPRSNAHPFLRVANVTPNGLNLDEVHSIELFDGELGRLRLQLGDLLVVEGNGSASQIGRAALWDGSIPDCVHQNHLIRVRPLAGLLPTYLEAVWNSPQNRSLLTDVASSSSGLHTLSVSKLKALAIPVPPVERQQELVAKVHEARAARVRLESILHETSMRSKALRGALLGAAFSGALTGSSIDTRGTKEMVAG